jgi:hypothetical protein
MTSEEEIRAALIKELDTRGAQTRISQTLEVSATTVMRWGQGETIPPAMQKLLRLYLFGEIPFTLLRPTRDAASVLEFTPEEWQLITILASRAGQEPKAWIRSQILAYLAFCQAEKAKDSTGYGQAPDPLYSMPKAADEGNEYRTAPSVPPGTASRTGND